MRLKAQIVVVILTSFLLGHFASAQFGQVTDSDAAMTNIRKHFLSSSRRTYNRPLLFVGVVEAFGPIYMGVCKEAVSEYVDFRIQSVISGEHQGSRVRAGYINCTQHPLPASPFALNGRVIVYCEQAPSLRCLAPVGFSEQKLAAIRSWTAGLRIETLRKTRNVHRDGERFTAHTAITRFGCRHADDLPERIMPKKLIS